jgi:hypothetical protein
MQHEIDAVFQSRNPLTRPRLNLETKPDSRTHVARNGQLSLHPVYVIHEACFAVRWLRREDRLSSRSLTLTVLEDYYRCPQVVSCLGSDSSSRAAQRNDPPARRDSDVVTHVTANSSGIFHPSDPCGRGVLYSAHAFPREVRYKSGAS